MPEEPEGYLEEYIEIEDAGDAIRLDVDMAIENLNGHLRRAAGDAPAAPARALECLCFDLSLGPMLLLFNSGRAELEGALAALRRLRDDPGRRIGSPVARSLARAAVELDPVIAVPHHNLFRSGAMGILRERGALGMFGDWPACVQVRGADKAEAERRLAWLLSQMAIIRLPHHAGDLAELAA